MTECQPLLQLYGVSKTFTDNTVLDALDLTIYDGEFLTLLGPSGCGKTTVLRIIAGFEQQDQGQVLLDDKDISILKAEHRPVNTVFQSYALFPHMSVYDNIAFGLKMHKVAKEEINERVLEALRMVRLDSFAQRKPHQLSGGQQQRVAIARAVVNRPRLLLLDESLSALDYKLRQEMQIELKRLQRQLNITFVYVTHDQEEALSMSDRIVVLNKGKVQQIGTPREIYETPVNLFVARFIGEINQFDGHVVRRIDDKHVEVTAEGADWIVQTDYPFAVNDKVHVLLRPEDVRLTKPELAENTVHIEGHIHECNYKGKTLDSYIRLSTGTNVIASEFFDEDDPDFDYRLGQKVALQWITGWEVVLPYEQTI
ncbi:spermidine/putrescine ABC transporter ATP-binding protein PotA [Psychromonas sp. L1A2]|uniref:spermidine/putrescine ABC transporter ATP-binding protein PotA n=1 Tax=Psychromonas sp. L1A2 TaxID=2686356 RepID=UPI00135BDE55|nr:spermidine/putrescine ABC transporter ATP-binding protein PotA [Psychromonas sp. L1A2]